MTVTPAHFLYARLREIPAIVALVDDRILRDGAEGEAFPYISFEEDDYKHPNAHDGQAGLARALWMVQVVSKNSSERDALGDLVRKALNGYDGTIGGLEVQSCQLVNGFSTVDPETHDYVRCMDFDIQYTESTV